LACLSGAYVDIGLKSRIGTRKRRKRHLRIRHHGSAMHHQLSRRDLLQLTGMVGIGIGAAAYLRSNPPAGRDVRSSSAAGRILADRSLPQAGPDDADVSIAIFSDYQCPACRMAEPHLLEAVKADGRVRFVHLDWPIFGFRSEQSARVALAANYQGKYEAVHLALMTEPRQLDKGVIRDATLRAGADWSLIERDVALHHEAISARLEQTKWDAFALGLPGTPGYLVGPLLFVGGQSTAEFRKAFQRARAVA
jgi:protein-disulfide isomerase